MLKNFNAQESQNQEEIELHWALKAIQHSQIYFKLITSTPHEKIKLTRFDDELYKEFKSVFPKLDISTIVETEFTNEENKKKWRSLIQKFEHVQDFNFGTLLRLDSSKEYSEENSFFVARTQFLCVEIARLREGLNQKVFGMKVEEDVVETKEMESQMKELEGKIVEQLK